MASQAAEGVSRVSKEEGDNTKGETSNLDLKHLSCQMNADKEPIVRLNRRSNAVYSHQTT